MRVSERFEIRKAPVFVQMIKIFSELNFEEQEHLTFTVDQKIILDVI
jgi:hypothetical protein